MAKYYTLLTRENKDDAWEIHFGDYDRECVEDERDDIKQGATRSFPVQTKIITTDEDQQSIDEAVRVQNIKFG